MTKHPNRRRLKRQRRSRSVSSRKESYSRLKPNVIKWNISLVSVNWILRSTLRKLRPKLTKNFRKPQRSKKKLAIWALVSAICNPWICSDCHLTWNPETLASSSARCRKLFRTCSNRPCKMTQLVAVATFTQKKQLRSSTPIMKRQSSRPLSLKMRFACAPRL